MTARVTRKDPSGELDSLHGKRSQANAQLPGVERAKAAEQALRESEERYRRLFEDDLTGDYLATVDGTIVDCNPAFVAILGFSSRTQALRTNLRKLHPHPEDYDTFVAALRAAGKLEHYDCIRQRQDGVCIHVVENVVAVSDAQGECRQIRGYLFDNTAAKAAEQALRDAEERYRNLIEFLPDAVIVADAAERIVFANPAAARLFRVDYTAKLVGRSLLDFFVVNEHEAIRARTEAAYDAGTGREPARRTVVLPDGPRIYVDTAVTPMRFDGQLCVLRVNRDVTARVEAEEHLLQKDREISFQIQKIEKLNSALTTLMEHREQEAEQRLGGIRTMLEELVLAYLANLKATSLTAEQQVLVDVMEGNLRNVTTSFARQVESWKMKLTPTELQIADLLRVGKRTKDIASLLRVSASAIAFHRNNIRAKLGLTRKPMNLVSFLRATAGSGPESPTPKVRHGRPTRRRPRPRF
jgi:PAS domain S-box-containing protein